MTFVRGAILADAGIGALPEFVGAEIGRGGEVERVLPGWELPTGTLSLLWPARRHQMPRMRAYLDHLASGFAQACATTD
jgi:DNA-binding transcriptional LysR family regulator